MSRIGAALLLLSLLALAACSDVRSMRRARDVQGLVALLSDADPYTRVKAIDALGYVGDSRAVAPLLKMLRDGDPYVREHAARNLGCDYHSSLGCDTGEAVQPLLSLLGDEDVFVRVEAARSLGEHPLPVVRQPLERLASSDPRWEARQAAAFALGRLGAQESVPVLEALLDDQEEGVVRVARESLRRIASARAAARQDQRLAVDVELTPRRTNDGGVDGGGRDGGAEAGAARDGSAGDGAP